MAMTSIQFAFVLKYLGSYTLASMTCFIINICYDDYLDVASLKKNWLHSPLFIMGHYLRQLAKMTVSLNLNRISPLRKRCNSFDVFKLDPFARKRRKTIYLRMNQPSIWKLIVDNGRLEFWTADTDGTEEFRCKFWIRNYKTFFFVNDVTSRKVGKRLYHRQTFQA